MKRVLASAIHATNEPSELSMEELAFEELDCTMEMQMQLEEFNQCEERFDTLSATLESLESAIDTYRKGESLSTESLYDLKFSLNDHASELSIESFDDFDQEISLEKLTGWWNRIKQVYVSDWHNMVDAFGGLIRGWSKQMNTHRKINRKLMAEWKNKKRDLISDSHKSSMAGRNIWAVFVVNNQLSREPLETMTKDIEYAEYMLETYPKDISSYLMDLKAIVERGDYDDDDNFERTVLQKVVKLGHPRDVFKLDIVGYNGHPLMMNRGLEETGSKDIPSAANGKEYEELAYMANGLHVKEYVMTWDMLAQAHLFHDFYFTTRQVDEMLDVREQYIDLVTNLSSGRFFPVDKMAKDILKLSPKIKDDEGLSPENVEAVAQINKVLKNFKDYIMRPMRMEVTRVISIVAASRTLISRTIATAETK